MKLLFQALTGRLISIRTVLFESVCLICLQVCTGVYKPHPPLHQDQISPVTEAMSCAHRDQVLEPELVEPHHVVEDVEAAVDLLLQENNVTFQP